MPPDKFQNVRHVLLDTAQAKKVYYCKLEKFIICNQARKRPAEEHANPFYFSTCRQQVVLSKTEITVLADDDMVQDANVEGTRGVSERARQPFVFV